MISSTKSSFVAENSLLQARFPKDQIDVDVIHTARGLGFVKVNKSYRKYPFKSEFPWCSHIVLKVNQKNKFGYATIDETEQLNVIESEIKAFLMDNHVVHYIASITQRNFHEILFYMDNSKLNVEKTKAYFDRIRKSHEVDFSIINDPQWKMAADFVK